MTSPVTQTNAVSHGNASEPPTPSSPTPNAASEGNPNATDAAAASTHTTVPSTSAATGKRKITKWKPATKVRKTKAKVGSTSGKRKSSRQESEVWTHFVKNSEGRAVCNYCAMDYACDPKRNGTSSMRYHIDCLCKLFPGREDNQSVLVFEPSKGIESSRTKLSAKTYDPEVIRRHIVMFVMIDEQPFRVVEGERFKMLLHYLEPRFTIPSRVTIARECLNIYSKEREKLKKFLNSTGQRVCLTTDTWTSVQNYCYMVLTCHFIDIDFNYHKKILNFCQITGHSGEVISKTIETCLLQWGVSKVLTITVDDASANDTALVNLRDIVSNWNPMNESILGNEFMHMRCCAHVLNLVVKDGLLLHNESIVRIRDVVKFVKASPSRMLKFKLAVEREKIPCGKMLCLDSLTRWNSTYLMLESAERFEKAFQRLERYDTAFAKEFLTPPPPGKRQKHPPTETHWSNARAFLKCLKVFYDATVNFSGSTYTTSNKFLCELCIIRRQLMIWSDCEDIFLKSTAAKMKEKYDKYWGDYYKINPYLFVAVLLDPRYKLRMLRICFVTLCGEDLASELTNKVKEVLETMFVQYKVLYFDSVANPNGVTPKESEPTVDVDFMDDFSRLLEDPTFDIGDEAELTEVDLYLGEARLPNVDNFDILSWWKVNVLRYPILCRIARDVLAIPISTVASESAFSTGGRIVEPHRSSLLPRTVEALVCGQNWLRTKEPSVDICDAINDLQLLTHGMC